MSMANLPGSVLRSPIVTLVVGGPSSPSREDLPRHFHVHQELLSLSSSVFNAAFQDQRLEYWNTYAWKEGETGVMHMPEDRIEDIEMLLSWLYQHISPFTSSKSSSTSVESHRELYDVRVDPPTAAYQAWKLEKRYTIRNQPSLQHEAARPPPPMYGPLIRLYIVADKYDVQLNLKQQIVSKIKDVGAQSNSLPNRADVTMIWNSIPYSTRSDSLKATVVRMYANLSDSNLALRLGVGREHGTLGYGPLHQEFLRDLLVYRVFGVLTADVMPCFTTAKQLPSPRYCSPMLS